MDSNSIQAAKFYEQFLSSNEPGAGVGRSVDFEVRVDGRDREDDVL